VNQIQLGSQAALGRLFPGTVVDTALDPLRVDLRDFTSVLENSQVRVLRLKLGPRQSVPMHEYVLNHLVVYTEVPPEQLRGVLFLLAFRRFLHDYA
jgi:hypothetical protein